MDTSSFDRSIPFDDFTYSHMFVPEYNIFYIKARIDWVDDNMEYAWRCTRVDERITFYFIDKEDLILFKLNWS